MDGVLYVVYKNVIKVVCYFKIIYYNMMNLLVIY